MKICLGIDVSKKTLDVCLISKDHKPLKASFSNNQKGFERIQKWILKKTNKPIFICTEATGRYDLGICTFLFQAGHAVSRANPLIVKRFSQTLMSRSKTDSKDSEIIALYCQLHEPRLWTPDREAIQKLKDLTHCLDSLTDDQARIKCRLEAYQGQAVTSPSQEIWLEQLRSITQTIEDVELKIQSVIKEDDTLRTNQELLESIPGIGKKSTFRLLAQVGPVEQYENARQLAAHIGITPCHKQSGSSVKGPSSISKMGNAKLRKALYLPAMTAMRCNCIVKIFAERLLQNGKPKKVAIMAAMRKLVHIIFGVLKNQTPFCAEN